MLIKDLEDSLTKRVHELGIRRVQGEFKDFAEGQQAAIIQTNEDELLLPYDLVVGADGAHSRVRNKLNIPCINLGRAVAGIAMVSATNPEKKIGLEPGSHKDVFIKKVTIPSASILLMQSRPDSFIEEMRIKRLPIYRCCGLARGGRADRNRWNIEHRECPHLPATCDSFS